MQGSSPQLVKKLPSGAAPGTLPETFYISTEKQLVFGRSSKCDVPLFSDAAEGDLRASRIHCICYMENEDCYLKVRDRGMCI
jgi:hypothetical protein